MNTAKQVVGRALDGHRKDPVQWQTHAARRGLDGDIARCSKLLEEVGEVQMALTNGGLPEELADCFIILLDIAYCNDVNIDKAIEDKLQVLREKWGGQQQDNPRQLPLFGDSE